MSPVEPRLDVSEAIMDTPAAALRLETAVAEYLDAVDRGQRLDRGEWLARFSDVSAELSRFLNDHDRMVFLATPIREAVVHSTVAWEQLLRQSTRPALGGNDETLGLAAVSRGPGELFAGGASAGRVGDYELAKELGRGGMGVVFQARDLRLNRAVALKMILAGQFAGPEDLGRFHAEAKAAAALEHPGIVPVFEVGQWQGQPFFAMPLVEGPSLAQRLAEGPLPPLEAARLLQKIVAAVAYAHARGIIHRDLKPANILLAARQAAASESELPHSKGEDYEPRITDFGLAKRIGGESHLTTSGQVLGTPTFMAPEQAAGRLEQVGPAADIYSLGAILYTMLTGRPPFTADNPVHVILQVLESEPALPHKLRPEVPRELEWICLKCLEKKPEDRYQSATELAADLDRFLRREPPEARSLSGGQKFRRWIRRQPVLAWHVIALAALLGLTQAIYLMHPGREMWYHARVTTALALWLAACWPLQWLLEQRSERPWSHYLWSAADVLFLTAVLSQLVSPLGPLLGGYLVLISVSGLFFQTRLVAFTTLSAMLGYIGLLILRPLEASPLHYALLFETTLAISGLVIGYQVWRNGILREYYEERRPR